MEEKRYELGKFKSTDVIIFATLLSKIGLGKVADAFGRDTVMSLLNKLNGEEQKDATAYVGLGIGLQIAEVILGNLEKCQDELFTLLSHVSGLSVEEVKDLDADVLFEMVVDVVHLPQFKNFTRLASRLLNSGK